MTQKRCKDSCGPPERIFQESASRIVTAEEMRAEGDAESLVEMLVDHNPAFGKRNS